MRLWRMDAPGRRGRFAAVVAKSNDDARAVGASDGIVSLIIFPCCPLKGPVLDSYDSCDQVLETSLSRLV